jgi:hypothetical protein
VAFVQKTPLGLPSGTLSLKKMTLRKTGIFHWYAVRAARRRHETNPRTSIKIAARFFELPDCDLLSARIHINGTGKGARELAVELLQIFLTEQAPVIFIQ